MIKLHQRHMPVSVFANMALAALGLFFLLPGASGALFYSMTINEFLHPMVDPADRSPSGALLFGILSSGSMLLSLILIGGLLRIGRWAWSGSASLVILVLAALLVSVTYSMLAAITDDIALDGLFLAALGGLGIGCLPPYLHWKKMRRTISNKDHLS